MLLVEQEWIITINILQWSHSWLGEPDLIIFQDTPLFPGAAFCQYNGLHPRGVRLHLSQVAIGFSAFSSEVSKNLLPGVVYNHRGRYAVTLKKQGESFMGFPFPLHWVGSTPAKRRGVYLGALISSNRGSASEHRISEYRVPQSFIT